MVRYWNGHSIREKFFRYLSDAQKFAKQTNDDKVEVWEKKDEH